MEYLRLIKYPGAKTSILPDIAKVYGASGCEDLVDVFGGSGLIALNLESRHTVYNDTNTDLVDLFRTVKMSPDHLITMLRHFLDIVENRKGGTARSYNAFINMRGEQLIRNLQPPVPGKAGSKTRKALMTIFRYSTSFGGMGDTYGTIKEKSVYRYLVRTLEDLEEVASYVHQWTIERLDFRDLVKKYDSSRAFFYFDPPYPGKGWYDSGLSQSDYRALANVLRGMEGKYLLNLDSGNSDLEEIFGEPAFSRSYQNRNRGSKRDEREYRTRLFYTNVDIQ